MSYCNFYYGALFLMLSGSVELAQLIPNVCELGGGLFSFGV